MKRQMLITLLALLGCAWSRSASAIESEAGNPVGNGGRDEIGIVSPVTYEAGLPVGHEQRAQLAVAPHRYDDLAYTFDDPRKSPARAARPGPHRAPARTRPESPSK